MQNVSLWEWLSLLLFIRPIYQTNVFRKHSQAHGVFLTNDAQPDYQMAWRCDVDVARQSLPHRHRRR